MKNENIVLSIKNLEVKFRVRSKILTAIRNVSFDLYSGEVLALVGESGSGKSVITKTFTGMLESNGWINDGSIIYNFANDFTEKQKSFFKGPVDLVGIQNSIIDRSMINFIKKYNRNKIRNFNLELKKIITLNNPDGSSDKTLQNSLINKKIKKIENKIELLKPKAIEFNRRKTAEKIDSLEIELKNLYFKLEIIRNDELRDEEIKKIALNINNLKKETKKITSISIKEILFLKKIIKSIEENIDSNILIKDEMKQYSEEYFKNKIYVFKIESDLKEIFDSAYRNKSLSDSEINLFSELMMYWDQINAIPLLKKIKANKSIRQIRGKTIATIFQNPMTSLNPLLTVGFQISEVLRRQLKMSRDEAKKETIKLLNQVGIPQPEERYKDIPGQYSGGMRQRVVIAIALACRPKILICDEPTTALDVTIQAQILRLIKKLQVEYKFSVIFITHDLGVVANIADRVAVMYAGQIVEIGTTQEIFRQAKHPYTWALLFSLPQLGTKGERLYSIAGTPPSLFNEIKGDAFAPRNKYALAIDYIQEPPMFKVSESHYAKTWLLHPKADKNIKPDFELFKVEKKDKKNEGGAR